MSGTYRHGSHHQRLAIAGFVLIAVCVSRAAVAQLRYRVSYRCNGEHVEVAYCRADSDMPGYPRTPDKNNYCLVYYPDRPKRGGFTVQTSELHSEIEKKLQSCGALPTPAAKGAGAPTQANGQGASTSASADAYLQQSNDYLKAQQFSKAAVAAKQSIALKPSFEAYDALGAAYYNLKQYSQSLAALNQAMALNSNDPTVLLNLATLYQVLKQYDKAISAVQQSLRVKPRWVQAINLMGMIYDDWGHNSEAAVAYEQAIHLDPSFTAAYGNLGELCLRLKNEDCALEVYRALERVDIHEANDLFVRISEADLGAKPKPSAVERAKAYKNLSVAALLAKANAGDDAVMEQLSEVYYAKHDSVNGLKWEIKAAERGDPELQNQLGWQYENGSGGAPRSIAEARQWYQKAGEQGNEAAQLNLCQSYAAELGLDNGVVQGTGKDDLRSPIPPPLRGNAANIDQAFIWCERGGNRGMYRAAWYTGVLNARGSATHPANLAEAYFWLTNGSLNAGKTFREKVGSRLTATQRALIEKLSAGFRPDPMELLHQQMMKASATQ
jgi:tetratricopeptide (TPR) repeat protein